MVTCGPITAPGQGRNATLGGDQLRAERIGVQTPRDRNEGAFGIGDTQRRDPRRQLRLKPASDETRGCMAVGKLRLEFRILQERQLRRARLVQHGKPADRHEPAPGIHQHRAGDFGDVGERQPWWLAEKAVMLHGPRHHKLKASRPRTASFPPKGAE
jgi:hypothetical protein